MATPDHSKETNTYSLKNVNFDDGCISAVITFSGAAGAALAYIKCDGKDIGVCALSGTGKESDTAACEIEKTAGVHDVTLTLCGYAHISDIEFKKTSPYDGIEYTPVPEETLRDPESVFWEATDMLGRKIASAEDVRGKKQRTVGIFYWSWREQHADRRPVSVTKVLEKYPGAEYNKNHPAWGDRSDLQCHWDEPFYGYYRNSDPYVIRRHASLLADAGVDMIMFDCTNGSLLWRDAYEPIFRGFYEARKDGIRVPKIAFMLNFGPLKESEIMLRALYQNLYRPGLYSDLWYRLDGKPMIMAYPECLPETGTCESDTRLLAEIREFFTFRPGQPVYAGGPRRPDNWGWLEVFPQNKYGVRPDGSCEMMTVGVGQNANDEIICTYFNNKDTYGRSYTGKDKHARLTKDSYKYGYNVQEQWDRAIDIDPDIIFITGWNEWIMGQFHEPWIKDPDSTQLAMVDQFDREHSRDIEMDRDGYLDTYYLQMAHNIRRYKGAPLRAFPSAEKAVDICRKGDWEDVSPEYKNDKGTTIHRDWPGFAGYHYKNDTGRNDVISAKVARDQKYLYFCAECAEPLTAPADTDWMTLYLDTDRNKETGWEGYDFVLNRTKPEGGITAVERHVRTGDGNTFSWEKIGDAEIFYEGNYLAIKVPRDLFFPKETTLDFEFKWSDNMQNRCAMDFYENGGCAPTARFNYRFREERKRKKK